MMQCARIGWQTIDDRFVMSCPVLPCPFSLRSHPRCHDDCLPPSVSYSYSTHLLPTPPTSLYFLSLSVPLAAALLQRIPVHSTTLLFNVHQVEFASVIVINKCDLVSPEHLQRVRAVVRALNGEAKVDPAPTHSAALLYRVVSCCFAVLCCAALHCATLF